MSRAQFRWLLPLLLLTAVALPAGAQVGFQPAGVDIGLGLGLGRGGGVRDVRDGIAASALVAWRVRPLAHGAMVVEVAAFAQEVIDGTDRCLVVAGGGCAPNYPGIATLSAMGGWEARHRRGAGLRLAAGPAAVHSREGAIAGGVQGRIAFATPSVARVAFVGWGQGTLVPQLRGDSYRVASFVIGVRVR